MNGVEDLLMKLAAMIKDLQRHINQRAREIAARRIEEAEGRAAEAERKVILVEERWAARLQTGQAELGQRLHARDRRIEEMQETHARERAAFEDLLGKLWLYINWRAVTRQLTTDEKELFADAVDAASTRIYASDEADHSPSPTRVPRWWRDDHQAEGA